MKKRAIAQITAILVGALCFGGAEALLDAQTTDGPPFAVSTCRAVVPVAVHSAAMPVCDQLRDPFLVNRRLALIEDGTVPCVEVDTLETGRCLFVTPPPFTRAPFPSSGHWVEDADGRRFAIFGQPVTRDGLLTSGAYIVGTSADEAGTVPCIAASGRDAAGVVAGSELPASCVVEATASSTNATGKLLLNYATRFVGTSSLVHPDNAERVSVDQQRSIAWFTGEGAALNDPAGSERGADNVYFGTADTCHVLSMNGVQVPAAKRPATRSLPAPGSIVAASPVRWTAYNPYVTIANDTCRDQRPAAAPRAAFETSVGLVTIFVDASASSGDIVRYLWDLEWTENPQDSVTTNPTTDFPVASGVHTGGWVTLTVISRDGRAATARQHVTFKPRIP